METWWNKALWWQFGAAIDMLENALVACPDSLWRQPVWQDLSDPSQGVEFWYVPYHALFWLDLYLAATLEGFAPPAPFTMAELDPAGALPERPYTKDELLAYLAYARPEGPDCAGWADPRAGAPTARPSLGERQGLHLLGVTTVQLAPRPGTCGPTAALFGAARDPCWPQLGLACEG